MSGQACYYDITYKVKEIWCFFNGLRLSFYMATKSLIAPGMSFIDIFNYAQVMDEMHSKTSRGSYKRL